MEYGKIRFAEKHVTPRGTCCALGAKFTAGDGKNATGPSPGRRRKRSMRRRWSAELVPIPSSVQTHQRVKSYEVPAGARAPRKVTSLVLILRVMLAEQSPIRCGRTRRGFGKRCAACLRSGRNSLDSAQGPAIPSTCTAGSRNLIGAAHPHRRYNPPRGPNDRIDMTGLRRSQ